MAEGCRRYSPIVGIEPSGSIFLDLTGLGHLYPDESALSREILGGLGAQGLGARVAIADTLGAAWAVARDERRQASPFAIVPPGRTMAALASLPVALLRIPAEAADLLGQLGVHRIGQLEQLPREELPARFGPEVLLRLDQALGRIEERLPAQKAPPEFFVQESFEYLTTDHLFLEQALRRLAERLSASLAEQGRGALRVEGRLFCPPAEPVRIAVGLFQAGAAGAHLFGLLQMQLERRRLAEPVVAMELEVPLHGPLERRQQELFSDVPPRRDARHLAALVDRLASRLGRHAVVRPRLVPDAQPELACTWDPLVGDKKGSELFSKRPVSRSKSGKIVLTPFSRPLRLLRRAGRLEVISGWPDGPPVQFRLRGRLHQVAESWGPERIETGWWRNRPVGRDYYRVETTEGQRYWIFRRMSDGQWFMHGTFE